MSGSTSPVEPRLQIWTCLPSMIHAMPPMTRRGQRSLCSAGPLRSAVPPESLESFMLPPPFLESSNPPIHCMKHGGVSQVAGASRGRAMLRRNECVYCATRLKSSPRADLLPPVLFENHVDECFQDLIRKI